MGRTRALGGRTNSLRSDKARRLPRASNPGPGGRRRINQREKEAVIFHRPHPKTARAGSMMSRFHLEDQRLIGILWPGGLAEQCSRHRGKGAHCLSAASLRAAEVGEPRREPEGPGHGQHGFGYFCRNKRTSSARAKPGNTGNHEDTRIGDTSAMRSLANTFRLAETKMDSR
jgi:hypothetical protein